MKIYLFVLLSMLITQSVTLAEWKITSSPSAASIRRFEFNEKNSKLYAFANKSVIYTTRDLDNFENWTEIKYNFTDYVREININSKEQIFILSTDSIFVSNDLGKSFKSLMKLPVKSAWEILFTVDDSLLLNTDVGLQRYDFTKKAWQHFGPLETPKDDNFVYDLVQKDSLILAVNENSIFESNDKGKSWKLIRQFYLSVAGNLTSILKLPDGNYLTCFLNSALYLIDSSGKTLKTFNNMKQITDLVVNDDGAVFALNSNNKYQTDVSVYKFIYSESDTSFIAYDNNLYGGDAQVAINIKNKGLLIALRNDGIYKLNSQNGIWQKTGYSLQEAFINFMANSKNSTLWASVYPNYLYKSNDEGKSWTQVRSFPRERFEIYNIKKMQENSKGYLYFQCSNKIFFTKNEGESWEEIPYPNSLNYINSFLITPDDRLIVGDDYKIYIWDNDSYSEMINWEKAIPVGIDANYDKLVFIGYKQYRHIYFDNAPAAFRTGSINTGFVNDKYNNLIIGDISGGLSYIRHSDYLNFIYEHQNNSECISLKSNGQYNVAIIKAEKSSIVVIDSTEINDISDNLANSEMRGFAFSKNKLIIAAGYEMYEKDIDNSSAIDELNLKTSEVKISNKKLYFDGEYKGKIKIFDILGQLLLQLEVDITTSINLEQLSAGLYFISVNDNIYHIMLE